jgi:hypothetical protein
MNTTKGLKLIGKGAFTKCYQLNDTTVLLKSEDPIKECMAHGWFPETDLFPKVEFSSIDGCYEMEYFPRVTSLKNNLDSDQYQIYKELRDIQNKIGWSINIYESYLEVYKAFEQLDNEELKNIMIEALEACGNCGSNVGFEISPKNVAVKKGKLILLDVFYIIPF